ncbi:MAG: hypothetical protein RLZZ298_3188 [Pseudomonadota bacterium]|jgi:uncharacterized protein HemX
MLKKLILLVTVLALNACASYSSKQADELIVFEPLPTNPRSTLDVQKIGELEKQLAERQRHCQAEKRRLELALKDNQKQSDELQKKLDSLLAIDRELRSRSKVTK